MAEQVLEPCKPSPSRAPAAVMWRPGALRKRLRACLLERTLRRLPRTDRVLDFCCGWGFYFMINPRARGIDGDPACVRFLRERGFCVDQADVLSRLPYADGAFDCVVAHDALEHFEFEQLRFIFAEVHRVLSPGGTFVVIVPHRKGYDYGLRMDVGHRLFVRREEVERLRGRQFELLRQYAEPLPRWIGRCFTHNKEVFWLQRADAPRG